MNSTSTKLVILCPSYFDRLGHPIFANKIKSELVGRFPGGIEIYGIDSSAVSLSANRSHNEVFPIRVLFGSLFTLDARKRLTARLGPIGLVISWLIRLIAVTHFYVMTFRRSGGGVTVLDLECEPIQALLASRLVRMSANVRLGFVIHAMPRNFRPGLMGIYKFLSLWAIRTLLRRSGRRAIFMNATALESAIFKGVARHQCILGGWGYSLSSKHVEPAIESFDQRIKVLAFGVIRRDKRISQLVELFLNLDDPRLFLSIVGKSVDVDVSLLRLKISESQSRTTVEILDTYVEEDEIPALFRSCQMVVLSHSPSFESMSGPMFLAIQYGRPILCFSGGTVASLVEESGAGLTLRLEDDRSHVMATIRRLCDWDYEPTALERFTWRQIADRMVSW